MKTDNIMSGVRLTDADLVAARDAVAALWAPIDDFRDPAAASGERLTMQGRPLVLPSGEEMHDPMIFSDLRVGPDGRLEGWHIWRDPINPRWLCEREGQ